MFTEYGAFLSVPDLSLQLAQHAFVVCFGIILYSLTLCILIQTTEAAAVVNNHALNR